MKPLQAFILCGGQGKRLRPLTNNTPKPLIKVRGKPITLYLVESLKAAGVKKIVLGTGFMEDKIRRFFGDGKKLGLEISYSHESTPLGTGGALKNAKHLISEKFFMLNGDNLFDIDFEKMNKVHEKNNALGTIALVQTKDVSSYGVARIEEDKITEFVEKPKKEKAPSNWINCGAYVLEKETIELLPDGFCLIEQALFPVLAKKQKLFAFRHSGQWFPIDTMERLKKAEKEWKNGQ